VRSVGGVDGTRNLIRRFSQVSGGLNFWQKVLTLIDLQLATTSSAILPNPLECAPGVATSWQRQLPREARFAPARERWFAVILPRR
jgi:hypothetical protein